MKNRYSELEDILNIGTGGWIFYAVAAQTFIRTHNHAITITVASIATVIYILYVKYVLKKGVEKK